MATRVGIRPPATIAKAPSLAPVEAVRDVGDTLATAIDKSVETRPYTTLLLAVGVGFLLGAIWAR